MPAPGPYTTSSVEVLDRLQVDVETGLTPAEVQARTRQWGPNELPENDSRSAWKILARQFSNVLIWILAGAIVLSLVLQETLEAIAITVIAVFTIILGFLQEYRAERAMDALRRLSAPHARVLRNGAATTLPSSQIVPGDILLLAQGDIVAADARLLDAADLETAEASLTGESTPVTKDADQELTADTALADRTNMVYATTTITRGRATAVATATGTHTEVGHIGRLLATVETQKTPLERQLDQFGRWLVWVAAAIVLVVVLLGILRGISWIEMLFIGVALAVAAVPEALPAVVTISLAVGAQRMARRNALVRRLSTVETLGSTTIICTDKTGTLTTGIMTAAAVALPGHDITIKGSSLDPTIRLAVTVPPAQQDAFETMLTACAQCSDAVLEHSATDGTWTVTGDPTEGALVALAARAGKNKADLEDTNPRIDEEPFDASTRRMITLHQDGQAYAKGAPGALLEICDRYWNAGTVVPLVPEVQEQIQASVQVLAAHGMRVMALAWKPDAAAQDMGHSLVYLGLVGIRDPPRPEAAAAIATCHDAGVRVLMITGDHHETARAIAHELGFLENGSDHVIDGRALDALDQKRFQDTITKTNVYARVSPELKLRIVQALQAQQEVVAMTGDGVNDAPALRQADIGIAMGITGTDVAKQAADMTLADDDFATIVAAIEEGRGIFANVRKYLVYLLSTNFGELMLIAAALALGLPLPLSAVMILYVNIASDGLPALALAVDPQHPGAMQKAPRAPGSGILDRPIMLLMLLGGLWSAVSNIAVFTWALQTGRPLELAMTTTFASLVLVQFVKAYIFRTELRPIWDAPLANKWLNRAVAWEILLIILLLYLPGLQALFGTRPLGAIEWLAVALAAVSIVPVLETFKWYIRTRSVNHRPARA